MCIRDSSVDVKEGDYAFMFYIDNHEEIKTDTLEIKKGFEDVYQLNFFFTPHMYEVDKPVIYLYPEEKKKVDVKLNVVGELSFTYPVYNEGWSVTADPSGNIQHKGNTYNYLFWEAKSAPHNLANEAEGFIISGEESSEFLQEKLEAIGFNSKERADFITYWGPRMSSNENVLSLIHI